MSNKSNDQGRAFEFVFITILKEEISKIRSVDIEVNSSYEAARRAWENTTDDIKEALVIGAVAAIPTLFDMEPLIVESGNDCLTLTIQPDSEGAQGDVRDILIIRRSIHWEIGLSLKHNHFAVKHSRLSNLLDFGEKWFGVPCSDAYWQAVDPVFQYLEEQRQVGMKWRELPSKEDDVYIPLLDAFIDEVKRAYAKDADLPAKMVEYLLGHFDFYKVIGLDRKRISQIQAYNLHGTLNKSSSQEKPSIEIPIASLPTRIVNFEMKPGSKNTAELYMDNGWQFGFRIHNASTKVESSLKFDVQIIGMPVTVISIDCVWMV